MKLPQRSSDAEETIKVVTFSSLSKGAVHWHGKSCFCLFPSQNEVDINLFILAVKNIYLS